MIKMMKLLLLLRILFLICCVGNKNEKINPITNTQEEISESNENNYIADPLILDGRQFVGYKGKAYRSDEAALIVSLQCNFNIDAAVPWHSLEGVEQLVNLKSLTIDGKNLSEVDFSPLSQLSNLKSLYFDGITHLPDLTILKQELSYIGIKDSRLESFEGIRAPNVKQIDISNSKEFYSLAPIKNLLYLEKLVINGGGSKVYKISDMSNLPNLKDLRLLLERTKIDLSGIEKFSALEELHVGWPEPYNIEGIGKLEKLQRLYLNLVSPQPSLEFLRNMHNLVDLSLSTVRKIEPEHILDVSPLATLKNLRGLSCTDFIIKNIASLDTLDSLSIQDDESPGYIYLGGCKLYNETDKSRHKLVLEHPVRE